MASRDRVTVFLMLLREAFGFRSNSDKVPEDVSSFLEAILRDKFSKISPLSSLSVLVGSSEFFKFVLTCRNYFSFWFYSSMFVRNVRPWDFARKSRGIPIMSSLCHLETIFLWLRKFSGEYLIKVIILIRRLIVSQRKRMYVKRLRQFRKNWGSDENLIWGWRLVKERSNLNVLMIVN